MSDSSRVEIKKPVFIFCLHRSGSTYLKNIIDSSGEVKILADEVHFDHPIFFNTFRKRYKRYCGDDINKYDSFLEVIDKGELRGTFWEYYSKIFEVQNSKNYLQGEESLNIWKSFNSILRQVLSESEESRIGIKYPAHFRYFDEFDSKYEGSRNIFLIRDPRAMVASKIKSPTNHRLNDRMALNYEILRAFTVIYMSVEFRYFVKKVLQNKKSSLIIRYEDLVLDQKNTIKEICDYCGIQQSPDMFTADGKSSGYQEAKSKEERINRWKKVLRKYETDTINSITGNSRSKLGYE